MQELHQHMHAMLPVRLQGMVTVMLFKSVCWCTAACIHIHAAISNKVFTIQHMQCVSEHPKHGAPGTANYIDARTRWFDQAVLSASKQGISQIVVIAAGFDSRAYKFHAPGLQVQQLLT